MIVQVGNGYLELNDSITVEKKVKLLDDVSATEGDFSYSFSIPKTKNNVDLINIYTVSDVAKVWNNKIPANLLDDSGVMIYSGFIRIEEDTPDEFNYTASFFSGNTNWIEELNFSLLDLDWSSFDVEASAIFDFSKSSGVVFPLTDNGLLYFRMHNHFMREDFQGYIYVKDVIHTLLANRGIKLTGAILKDPNYNKLITSAGTNKYLSVEIDNRTAYVGKSTNQTVTGSYATATFTNVSDPFSNSSLGNWSTVNSRYTWDLEPRDYEITLNLNYASGDGFYYTGVRIRKNGVTALYEKTYKTRLIRDTFTVRQLDDTPSAGDYYEVQVIRASFSGNRTLLSGSSITIKPTAFYKTFANTIIPDMTGSDFICNIFRMLNCVVTYNNLNKTIRAEFFDKVLSSDPLDVSEHIRIKNNNFEDFVSDYARTNLLLWQDQSNDPVEQYNEDNILPYGSGVIEIDNDFLEDENTLLEMDFVAAFQRQYPELGMELPMAEFVTASVVSTRDITSVSLDSSSGLDLAVFNYSGSDISGSLVRIFDSSIAAYNGDYYALGSGSSFNGYVEYQGNATATMQVLRVEQRSSDPVLLLNNPGQDIRNISGLEEYFIINLVPRTEIMVANFLNTENYIGSLGFDYLKNVYFNKTEKLLNNGVRSLGSAYLPSKIYKDIDFLRPLRIDGVDFYADKLTGYLSSDQEADIQLIKI